MLTRAKTTGPGKRVRFLRRKQKRNPRRLLEALPADWERWDRAAQAAGGLNWSEFTRRALNAYALAHAAQEFAVQPTLKTPRYLVLKSLSEKGAIKRARSNGAKAASTRSRRKG